MEDHRLVHQDVELAEKLVHVLQRLFFLHQLLDMLAKTRRECAVNEDFTLHGLVHDLVTPAFIAR